MFKSETADQTEDKNVNQYQKALQTHFIAQWITSLAISVVCCAVLFVVFAGYIVKLHEKTNIAEVRLEVLTERHNQLHSEVAQLRRAPLVQINSQTPPQVAPAGDAQTPPVDGAQPAPPADAQPQAQPAAEQNESKLDDVGISLPQTETPAEAAKNGKQPSEKPAFNTSDIPVGSDLPVYRGSKQPAQPIVRQ